MKLLVIQVAALGYELWQKHAGAHFWKKLKTKNPILTVSTIDSASLDAFKKELSFLLKKVSEN